ncbi:Branched-chain-amino-acid aminotransferase [Gimesia alba]|uniref:branched-chain-amino-acid transaminase n=1 Tax=Gimesia alba TaxID=2527973 RepID=A0A517RGA7_9PLAN|nr:aminotransferase class IV [Gimesia alba]QDT42914.1 Branched-chain-amino-acid aminotransferase [Gimesia alba]
MTEPLAYLNGALIPFSEAKLSVTDLGIVYGAAVTEMVRTFAHRPFMLDEHLDRLYSAMDYVCIESPLAKSELKQICEDLIEQNAALLPQENDLGLTVFITAGQNLPYLGLAELETCRTPTVCVHTFPLAFELWDQKYTAGQHLVRSEVQQLNANIFDPRVKSRSRIHLYRADKLVRKTEPEASALLFDVAGFVAETTIGNFYLVKDNLIVSPRPEKILGGISQQMVVRLVKQLGLRYVEADISAKEILEADEALTSSTGYCLMPVTRFGESLISEGVPGPVFTQLLSEWSETVGVDIVKQAKQIGAARRNALS